MNSEYIFDVSREDWQYKGLLFAEIDNQGVIANYPGEAPPPRGYVAGFMALIWVDESGEWHVKGRFKFPSGNKQTIGKSFGKECNETKILTSLYQFPFKNKKWYPNKKGTIEGIMEILEESDMIESKRIINVEKI